MQAEALRTSTLFTVHTNTLCASARFVRVVDNIRSVSSTHISCGMSLTLFWILFANHAGMNRNVGRSKDVSEYQSNILLHVMSACEQICAKMYIRTPRLQKIMHLQLNIQLVAYTRTKYSSKKLLLLEICDPCVKECQHLSLREDTRYLLRICPSNFFIACPLQYKCYATTNIVGRGQSQEQYHLSCYYFDQDCMIRLLLMRRRSFRAFFNCKQ